MSLLCVIANYNTYVILKVDSVRSTTHAVKGAEPCWNQKFYFEINELNDTGLIIELWNRGMSWDKLLGVHWLPLNTIKHSELIDDESNDIQVSLDSELCLDDDGKVVGTQTPTPHTIILNARVEILSPEINESESIEFQQKIELLNDYLKREGLSFENGLESLILLKDISNQTASSTTADSDNETGSGGAVREGRGGGTSRPHMRPTNASAIAAATVNNHNRRYVTAATSSSNTSNNNANNHRHVNTGNDEDMYENRATSATPRRSLPPKPALNSLGSYDAHRMSQAQQESREFDDDDDDDDDDEEVGMVGR